MPQDLRSVIYPSLKAPRAAAIAGILFALLFGGGIVLIRFAVPPNPDSGGRWLRDSAGAVSLALSLMPLSGIAFLWFIGVVRDRLDVVDDQFLSVVFVGSGLLFLALTFVSASCAGAVLTLYAQQPDRVMGSGLYDFGRAVSYQLSNVYAVKMAGVFMCSLGTTWLRTMLMPRGFVLLTYTLALTLLLTIDSSLWVTLVFPAWVCMISIYLLVRDPHRNLATSPPRHKPEPPNTP